ncbi:Radical SAM-linked protein [uncultured Eubacteriales bacterium]|uniref:Radical SAM-linked protein n=1 Tax=uncultured Eubacteriales bacterium TaxID=172733 RepID=A0A212K1F3_9FIRM|nr:Radical SAM-linked protein [uncultured Eubacteriales bacterium]
MRNEHRLRFSKLGRARYISHLDLMGTFQRAFLRAGIDIKHTEGFNPHAFVSIPLPLSVGFGSECEVLDFQLVREIQLEEVPGRINAALPEGIVVQKCYEAERPAKALTYVNYIITLEYESGTPVGTAAAIQELFTRESLVVSKRSKKAKSGQVEVDLIPLIAKYTVEGRRDSVTVDAVLRAQNPGLNPELMVSAIRSQCPAAAPDFVSYYRKDVLDADFQPWE